MTDPETLVDRDPYKKSMAEVVVYAVRIFALVSITLLVIRFFLQLFGANPTAAFTNWVYESSAIVLQPFRGIFRVREINADTGSVLDVSVLFAIVMYMLLAYWMGTLIETWERKRLTEYRRDVEKARKEQEAKEREERAERAKKQKQSTTTTTVKRTTTKSGSDE